jgi:nicotinamidase-related amidase
MTARVWDRFLTERDQARSRLQPAVLKGGGMRPVLLLVDLYRWVFGDEPEDILVAIQRWPGSCGLDAWQSLPHIQRLLGESRALGIPVVHVTGDSAIPSWRDPLPGLPPADAGRASRRHDIIEQVAPLEGEVVLRKSAPSAFWGTPLQGHLTALRSDTLIIAGESTSGCVRATVVDAKSLRYRVLVPEECVFDRDEASHAINLFDMNEKYADVIPLDDVLTYARRTTGGDGGLVDVRSI